MDAPEELAEAVALAMAGVSVWNDYPDVSRRYHQSQAVVALAVPGIADALARDAAVAEILRKWDQGPAFGPAADGETWDAMGTIAALYPEAGK